MWNRDSIAAQRRAKVLEKYEDADRAALIERIIELETALYPFAYTLGALGDKAHRGTTATSKLFPMKDDAGRFSVYENGVTLSRDDIPESELHEVEYYEEDSLDIRDGTLLHDDFEILAVHQSAPGAYVSCGAISMGDVRWAAKKLFDD